MRVETPEISWHNTTPVYSCDFQPNLKQDLNDSWLRLATCGRDNYIRIWKVHPSTSKPHFIACLRRHEKPVNVVRFIPTGEDVLASGGDDGLVILWKRDSSASNSATSSRTLFGQDGDEDEECSELWQVNRILRRHLEDVYDLSWSADGQCLISGSVDHSAIEWNLKSGQQLLLKDHKQYVQGVAWDPLDEYVLSMGSDRSCRVYRVGSRNCSYNIVRHEKQRLFQDDSWKSFFRRLSFSPDGSFLVCPAGCHGMDGNAAYVFTRQSLPSPVLALPTETRPVVAVRFCPSPFCLPEGCTPVFALPYYWLFCLVLEDAVLIYNTISKYPIAYVGAIHYQALNDATWSVDGRVLAICSTDGYCSFAHFGSNELGQPYTSEKPIVGVPSSLSKNSNNSETLKTTSSQKHSVDQKQTPSVSASSTSCKTKTESSADRSAVATKDVDKHNQVEMDQTSKANVVASQALIKDDNKFEPSKISTSESPEKQSTKECKVVNKSDTKSSDTCTSPKPAKKKRRVTFVTLGSEKCDKAEPMDTCVGDGEEPMIVDEQLDKQRHEVEDETPKKRRIPITTISSEPLRDDSSSPLQAMKRRVAFTTLTSQVTPEDVTDNLSNMSAPEFNLTLDDSMSENRKPAVGTQDDQ